MFIFESQNNLNEKNMNIGQHRQFNTVSNYSNRNTWARSLYQNSTRFRYFGRSCITEEQMVHIYQCKRLACGVEIICKITRRNSTKQIQFGQTKYICELGKPKWSNKIWDNMSSHMLQRGKIDPLHAIVPVVIIYS